MYHPELPVTPFIIGLYILAELLTQKTHKARFIKGGRKAPNMWNILLDIIVIVWYFYNIDVEYLRKNDECLAYLLLLGVFRNIAAKAAVGAEPRHASNADDSVHTGHRIWKKRSGRSIGFCQEVEPLGERLIEIDTVACKASQYNHTMAHAKRNRSGNGAQIGLMVLDPSATYTRSGSVTT